VTDDWDRTPVHGLNAQEVRRRVSVNAPAFGVLAADLARRLERLGTVTSRALAAQGRELAATFDSWREVPPIDGERVRAISSLLDYNSQALDLLAGGR
jgi:hypothetical protein